MVQTRSSQIHFSTPVSRLPIKQPSTHTPQTPASHNHSSGKINQNAQKGGRHSRKTETEEWRGTRLFPSYNACKPCNTMSTLPLAFSLPLPNRIYTKTIPHETNPTNKVISIFFSTSTSTSTPPPLAKPTPYLRNPNTTKQPHQPAFKRPQPPQPTENTYKQPKKAQPYTQHHQYIFKKTTTVEHIKLNAFSSHLHSLD